MNKRNINEISNSISEFEPNKRSCDNFSFVSCNSSSLLSLCGQKSHTIYIDWRDEINSDCIHGKIFNYWTKNSEIRYFHLNENEKKCWITFKTVETASNCVENLKLIQDSACSNDCEFKTCHLEQNAADFLYLLQTTIAETNALNYVSKTNTIQYYIECLRDQLLGTAGHSFTKHSTTKLKQVIELVSRTSRLKNPYTALKTLKTILV